METHGFFDAEELLDGTYDREYVAKQWADYFKLFIGNGVFVSPVDQLMVKPTTGMVVKVTPGWAFINGYWYHNDEDLEITIPTNSTANSLHTEIFIRLDLVERTIAAVKSNPSNSVVEPTRDATTYDLRIADILVNAGVISLTEADIVDERPNNDVCGFVTGVVDVINSDDLFAHYQGLFDRFMSEAETDLESWETDIQGSIETWFETIEGRLSSDVAVDLQNQINALKDFYVQNHTLFLPNTAATVSDGVLTIGTT